MNLEGKKLTLKQLWWFFRYFWPYRWRWIGLTILSLVMVGIGLLDPLILRFIIDDILTKYRPEVLVLGVLLFLAAKLGSTWLLALYGVGYEKFMQRVLVLLRKDLFERIEYKKYEFFNKRELGDLIKLLTSDVASIRGLLASSEQAFVSILKLIVILSIVTFISWQATLIFLVTIPFFVAVQYSYLKKVQTQAVVIAAQDVAVMNFFTARLSNILLVKLFSQEARELQKEHQITKTASKMTVGLLSNILISIALIGTISVVALAALLWYTGMGVFAGMISVGSLVALYNYFLNLFGPISTLVSIPLNVQQLRTSLIRITEVLQEGEEWRMRIPVHFTGDIKFENVNFAYPSAPKKIILDDFSFHIAPGERVAIVGESGSGKSSIALLLLRFYEPNSGSIRIDDIPIGVYSPSTIRSRMSFSPQGGLLFPGSIYENITYSDPVVSMKEVEHASELAAIHDRITRMQNGYYSLVGSGGNRLSGGEKQRISLARAFLKKKDFYIFDEPTSALDVKNQNYIKESIQQITEGHTTIIITHRLSTVDFVDRILVLDNGKIVEQGPYKELMHKKKGKFYALYAKQQKETGK